MNRPASDRPHAGIELLLSFEREIAPQPASVRTRAIERARASLPRSHWEEWSGYQPRHRVGPIGKAAALVAILSATSAAAFYAGYLRGERQSGTHAVPVVRTPSLSSAARRVLPVPSAGAPTAVDESPPPEPPRPTTKARTHATSVQGSESYALEVRVLQPAQKAVASRNFGAALTAIGEHQHRFPRGKLAEEREALRIRCLVGLGRRAEAERAGAAFRRRFPRSALVGRLDQMLGTPP